MPNPEDYMVTREAFFTEYEILFLAYGVPKRV